MKFNFSSVLSPRVLVGIIVVAILALVITCIRVEWFAPTAASAGDVVALLTVIPAPTGTPLPPPTPTIDLNAPTPTPTLAPGQIAIGSYVQIKGTEGIGLRIRSAPGLSGNSLFIAYDAEVFVVKGGPRQVDGYTWYSLAAPNDETRAGWAASEFFTIISPPQGYGVLKSRVLKLWVNRPFDYGAETAPPLRDWTFFPTNRYPPRSRGFNKISPLR